MLAYYDDYRCSSIGAVPMYFSGTYITRNIFMAVVPRNWVRAGGSSTTYSSAGKHAASDIGY